MRNTLKAQMMWKHSMILSFPSVKLGSFHFIVKSFDALQGDSSCIRRCQKAHGTNYMIQSNERSSSPGSTNCMFKCCTPVSWCTTWTCRTAPSPACNCAWRRSPDEHVSWLLFRVGGVACLQGCSWSSFLSSKRIVEILKFEKSGPILIRRVQMVACRTYLQMVTQDWSCWMRVLVFLSIHYFELPRLVRIFFLAVTLNRCMELCRQNSSPNSCYFNVNRILSFQTDLKTSMSANQCLVYSGCCFPQTRNSAGVQHLVHQ